MRKTGAGRQNLDGLAISELGNAGFRNIRFRTRLYPILSDTIRYCKFLNRLLRPGTPLKQKGQTSPTPSGHRVLQGDFGVASI